MHEIVAVDETNLDQAAAIHSASWKASHRAFCAADFIEMHTPDRQRAYLRSKMNGGAGLYMLVEERPIGIVSVTGSLIEDLYVLPDMQNRGYGTQLLQYAIDQCADTPTLWILENNINAERLYRRMGFVRTGRRKSVTDGLDEIEFALTQFRGEKSLCPSHSDMHCPAAEIKGNRDDMEGTEIANLPETERLFLREMRRDDDDALYRVLADADIMRHYPYAFDEARVRDWIDRNRNRYRENGFGLWAVCLKESGEMIGDCGLTLQPIKGESLPEIGYHIRRDCQRRGYAREAAKAVRDWAFRNTEAPALYSYCKYTNEPSIRTAESIGMHFNCEYPDEANGITHVSVISRQDWLSELTENMIRWAESRLGSTEYAGWCLSFIEDALEKSNVIEIFGGDCAKESCELYRDALRGGEPERGAFVFYDCLCLDDGRPVNWGHCGISLGDGRVIHAWDKVRTDDYLQIEQRAASSGEHPKYIGWVPLSRVLAQKP